MYRFAISKDMHLEQLREAAFNYICAKQNSKPFSLIFMDTKGFEDKKDEEILAILGLFGIECKVPYYQSANIKFYRQFAIKLLQDKKAFSCFCQSKKTPYDGTCKHLSDFEVLNNESHFSIRINRPTEAVKFKDTIKGEIVCDDLDDFIIMTKDKYPTCDFALAIDDMLQNITHVISKNSINSTAKQIHIRKSLRYDSEVIYTHLPPILYENKENPTVLELLEQGYLPDALINYLMQLCFKTPCEIFTLNETLKWFDISKISSKSAHFDSQTLKRINREHIKKLDDEKLALMLGFKSKDIGKLAKFYTKYADTLNELKAKIEAIFSKKEIPNEYKNECEEMMSVLQNAPIFSEYEEFLAHICEKMGKPKEQLKTPLQILLTNNSDNIELENLYTFIKNYIKEIVR